MYLSTQSPIQSSSWGWALPLVRCNRTGSCRRSVERTQTYWTGFQFSWTCSQCIALFHHWTSSQSSKIMSVFGFRAARKRNGRELIPTVLLPEGERRISASCQLRGGEQVGMLYCTPSALKTPGAETLVLTELVWKDEGGKKKKKRCGPPAAHHTAHSSVQLRSGPAKAPPPPGSTCGWFQRQGTAAPTARL